MNQIIEKQSTAIEPRSNQPLMPTEQDLNKIKYYSEMIYNSGLIPDGLMGDGASKEKIIARISIVMLKGYELRISPMQSFAEIGVIHGIPVMSGKLMLAIIYRDVPNAEIKFQMEKTQCIIRARRSPRRSFEEFKYTTQDAAAAGLIKSGSAWAKYPTQMLKWRCVANMARTLFPDVIMGCYIPEEIEIHGKSDNTTMTKEMQYRGYSPTEEAELSQMQDRLNAAHEDEEDTHEGTLEQQDGQGEGKTYDIDLPKADPPKAEVIKVETPKVEAPNIELPKEIKIQTIEMPRTNLPEAKSVDLSTSINITPEQKPLIPRKELPAVSITLTPTNTTLTTTGSPSINLDISPQAEFKLANEKEELPKEKIVSGKKIDLYVNVDLCNICKIIKDNISNETGACYECDEDPIDIVLPNIPEPKKAEPSRVEKFIDQLAQNIEPKKVEVKQTAPITLDLDFVPIAPKQEVKNELKKEELKKEPKKEELKKEEPIVSPPIEKPSIESALAKIKAAAGSNPLITPEKLPEVPTPKKSRKKSTTKDKVEKETSSKPKIEIEKLNLEELTVLMTDLLKIDRNELKNKINKCKEDFSGLIDDTMALQMMYKDFMLLNEKKEEPKIESPKEELKIELKKEETKPLSTDAQLELETNKLMFNPLNMPKEINKELVELMAKKNNFCSYSGMDNVKKDYPAQKIKALLEPLIIENGGQFVTALGKWIQTIQTNNPTMSCVQMFKDAFASWMEIDKEREAKEEYYETFKTEMGLLINKIYVYVITHKDLDKTTFNNDILKITGLKEDMLEWIYHFIEFYKWVKITPQKIYNLLIE